MAISNIDDFRSVLSDNFKKIIRCLLPLALESISGAEREDAYLKRLSKAALSSRSKSRTLARNLVGRSGRCSFEIEGETTHKKIYVDFSGAPKPCEIGDIMLVSKFVDYTGVLSRNISLLQAKVEEKKSPLTWHITPPTQLMLYKNWPLIKCCYTGTRHRNPLLKNFKLHPNNRWFSPYLLVMRKYHYRHG